MFTEKRFFAKIQVTLKSASLRFFDKKNKKGEKNMKKISKKVLAAALVLTLAVPSAISMAADGDAQVQGGDRIRKKG